MSTSLTPPTTDLNRLPCPTCGGSGVLRLNHHRFRTCLECLGQGVLPQFSGSPELTRILQRRSEPAVDRQPAVPTEVSVSAGSASAVSR